MAKMHWEAIEQQLSELYYAFALAYTSSRILILPKLVRMQRDGVGNLCCCVACVRTRNHSGHEIGYMHRCMWETTEQLPAPLLAPLRCATASTTGSSRPSAACQGSR